MTEHNYTTNYVDTVTAAIKAGCNMELTSGYDVYLYQVRDGQNVLLLLASASGSSALSVTPN